MTATMVAPADSATSTNDGSQLAAVVLFLDGRRYDWRDAGLADDPDVTDWLARALTPCHPDYASLWWADLERMRAART